MLSEAGPGRHRRTLDGATCGGGTLVTKAFHRFDQRVSAYDSDLELADIFIGTLIRTRNTNQSVCEALGGRPEVHVNLHATINTKASRNSVGRHFRKTLYSSFIKDLYEDFSEYLSTSLSRSALAGVDPTRFIGEVKLDLRAADILSQGNWDGVVRLLSEKIFRALEHERSTITLINKLSGRLGLGLDQAIVDAAMPYLDARHILIHRDGVADDVYKNTYPNVALAHGRIQLNFDFIAAARAAVRALARHIDEQLIAVGLVREQDHHAQAQAPAPAQPQVAAE